MDDNKTGTKRAIGLFIIIIMFFSIVGYGLISSQGNFQNQQQPQNQPNISIINIKELSTDEKLYVFSIGRVLFEHFYPEGCLECLNLQSVLVNFTVQFQQNVVLETVPGFNQTSLNMFVYRGGDKISIIPIDTNNLTQDSLVEFFCDNSPVRPKECLFREFNTQRTPQAENISTEATNTTQTNITQENTNKINTTAEINKSLETKNITNTSETTSATNKTQETNTTASSS